MNILFVCTGNTCRSAMAAAIMNKIVSENDMEVFVDSAGIFAENGLQASAEAVEALKKYDIDLSAHRAKVITPDLFNSADIVFTMTDIQKEILNRMGYDMKKVFTIGDYAGADTEIDDPYGSDLSVYEETAEELYDLLVDAAEKIEDGRTGADR